jgi:hypothetical protein
MATIPRLLEAHGGDISVTSNKQTGTTFAADSAQLTSMLQPLKGRPG